MKYILFDAVTNILFARYDSEINTVIPKEAIEVDDEIFFATIDQNDGVWKLIDGSIIKEPLPLPTINQVKDAKLNEIRKSYESDALTPVNSLGVLWDGGFDSAIKLDAAKRLCEAAGAPGVRFFDNSNNAHNLSFTDALTVCIDVAVAFQNSLAKKQALFGQVKAAESLAEIEAIKW